MEMFRIACDVPVEARWISELLGSARALASFNPLVIDVRPAPEDPDLYTITDRVPLCFDLSIPVRYRARVVRVEVGFDSEVEVFPWIRMHNRLRWEERRPGVTTLQEEVRVEGPRWLERETAARGRRAHEKMLEAIDAAARRIAAR